MGQSHIHHHYQHCHKHHHMWNYFCYYNNYILQPLPVEHALVVKVLDTSGNVETNLERK